LVIAEQDVMTAVGQRGLEQREAVRQAVAEGDG
jgi:hypothetical protein